MTPLRSKLAGILPCDGTFDIECYDWDRFLVAGTYEPSGGSRVHRSPEELVDYLLKFGGTWWSHCGGQYDALCVADVFERRGLKASIDYPRSRVTRMVSSGLTLRDSWALIPLKLDRIAQLAGVSAAPMPWQCNCRLRCAGYCRLTASMRDGDPDLDAKVTGDCYALYKGLEKIAEHASSHGIDLRGTVGSSAWATAQDRLALPNADLPSQTWKRIKEADYGGRTIIVQPQTRRTGNHWDLSSAYPAALARCALPVGEPSELGCKGATLALAAARPGVYRATVRIPDSFYPPLPWRHDGRLVYPLGKITGAWALPELEAAIARGVTIEKVISAIVWPKTSVLFGELMAEWYKIRRDVGKATPLGEWQRLLANSLTGKFAEQASRTTVRMHPESVRFCEREGKCSRGCTGKCEAWRQLDRWGHLWSQPYYRMAPSGHVQWSAYLKAHTRIAWLTEMEKHGTDGVYGDTDSIWTVSRRVPEFSGSALGAWELKHAFTDWECSAVKCYRFVDPSSDLETIRAAGARDLTDSEWKAGASDQSRGVQSLLEAAHNTHETGGGLFRRRERFWSLPGHDTDHIWYGDRKLGAGGITYPVSADEHRERWARQTKRKRKPARGIQHGKVRRQTV